MNDNTRIFSICALIIIAITFLIFYYINYCREYDSKIDRIYRYTYVIKIDRGRMIVLENDEKMKDSANR